MFGIVLMASAYLFWAVFFAWLFGKPRRDGEE